MDFDGDTAAVIRIHDIDAQKELENNAYILNCIQYDQNPTFINKCKGEAMYAAYTLLSNKYDNQFVLDIKELSELPINDFTRIFNITQPVRLNNEIYSYGVCLFNLWCGFTQIKVSKFIEPNELSKLLYYDSTNNYEYHNRLQNIMVKLFWFSSLNYKNPLTFSFSEISNLDFTEEKSLLKMLPNNPFIGQHLYSALIHRIHKKIPESHFFGKLIASKLGKVKTQLSRISGAIGYIADDNNIILNSPLKANLIDGLDPDTFFNSAIGARKGIVDKNRSTPQSGYLERSLVLNLSPIEIGEETCNTDFGMLITIQNKDHAISLINRYYGQYDPNNVSPIGISKIIGSWKLFSESDIEKSVGKTYIFKSPITCQTNSFKICRHCFGEYPNIKTPFLGIITGQSIAERMTQLSMRTFHTSGSSTLPVNKKTVDFIESNLVNITNSNDNTCLEFVNNLTKEIVELFNNIPGFQYYSQNKIYFENIYNVENQDVTQKIKAINKLLLLQRKTKNVFLNPSDTYNTFINIILELGLIYSSFVEIVLTNMFVKDKIPIRYLLSEDFNVTPDIKLNVKQLHSIISKLLGLLYEPNSISISTYSNMHYDLIDDADTVFERLWKGTL